MRTATRLARLAAAGAVIATLGAPLAADDRVEDGTLAFGLALYGQLKTRPANLVFSPYSVSTALAMARVGARGDTARQMDAVLHLPPDSSTSNRESALKPDDVRDGFGRDAKRVPAYSLELANALWVQQGLNLEAPFSRSLAEHFGAPARQIDFRHTDAARARINDWVAKQTRGRIQDIVPEGMPTPATQLALANAIFFKAAWQQPFQKSATRQAPFTTSGGASIPAAFMHRHDVFRYMADEHVQVVEIPYRGNRTSMVVVLPRTRDGLAALERELSAARVSGWLDALKPATVKLALPRFEFTRFEKLSRPLRTLGMKDAFTGRADFSGITRDHRLFIDVVLHKAFIAVDEAGTEAAAATVVMMRKGKPSGGETLTADHPFLFLIRHRTTGTVLFIGCVERPSA